MRKAFEEILDKIDKEKNLDNEKYKNRSKDKRYQKRFLESHLQKQNTLEEVKNIVKAIVEKYNDGWIPVSKRLPDETNN